MADEQKVVLIGGGGIRTPLLVHALAEQAEAIGLGELVLCDVDSSRAQLMALLGQEIVRQGRGPLRIRFSESLPEAVSGARFVLSSLRVGGIDARARDEAGALRHGLVGQETTGPGGWAMALRTIPVTLEHARVVEKESPDAWFVSFTNPAGLITQAISQHTAVRGVGICDTPSELFHQIAHALGASAEEVECEYAGLNHLGWVSKVRIAGRDVTDQLLADEGLLRGLYPAPLFDPELIQSLRLIPSEYLFFYYNRHLAHANQQQAGATRGQEVARLNKEFLGSLEGLCGAGQFADAVEAYKRYLRQRSGSYMQLEGNAGSLTTSHLQPEDPFEAATGYHRIALGVMSALAGKPSQPVVVNTRNRGSIAGLKDDDVVEVGCRIDRFGVRPLAVGELPDSVKGLVLAVKEYERLTIAAAVEKSKALARLALFINPIVSDWNVADRVCSDFLASDPQHLAYLH